jgi:hypothetical protein
MGPEYHNDCGTYPMMTYTVRQFNFQNGSSVSLGC